MFQKLPVIKCKRLMFKCVAICRTVRQFVGSNLRHHYYGAALLARKNCSQLKTTFDVIPLVVFVNCLKLLRNKLFSPLFSSKDFFGKMKSIFEKILTFPSSVIM